ncbi:unnamed protein product [Oncorhynchus mykiss]|uniref:PH domain-containing protein n=1 Tax=Oncorhynchus mykiss TaxID=8022 RepID=A0A060Y755_ONCMY|nr:unnamed protein product [Oncorhynchus mykiss]
MIEIITKLMVEFHRETPNDTYSLLICSDDFPLASLPLLGYTVSSPGESDSIHKEYVFKLHFKSHVYFFRAESEYTFERWMEVIKSAASATGRMSLLIPKGPLQMNGN